MQHIESRIQSSCKRWFNLQYPKMARLLFAVPNGGRRGKVEAMIMKGEGVEAGVADMILGVPSNGFGSLCIKFKTNTGRQSPAQKSWQALTEQHGNKYVVVRSIDDFIREVKTYLSK